MISKTDRQIAMKYANIYSDCYAIHGVDEAYKRFEKDCKNGVLTTVQSVVTAMLIDTYYNAKKGIITREEATIAQNAVFNNTEVEYD